MRPAPAVVAAVFLGGALGTLARYGIGLIPLDAANGPLALMTACNLLGSALLGAISAWPPTSPRWAPLRVGLGTGFCGGFTTLSYIAFALVVLITADPGSAEPWGVLLLGVLGGLAANWLGAEAGARLGRRLIGSGIDWKAASAERVRAIWAQTREAASSARRAAGAAVAAQQAAHAERRATASAAREDDGWGDGQDAAWDGPGASSAHRAAGSTAVGAWDLEADAAAEPVAASPGAAEWAAGDTTPLGWDAAAAAPAPANGPGEDRLPTAAFDPRAFDTEVVDTARLGPRGHGGGEDDAPSFDAGAPLVAPTRRLDLDLDLDAGEADTEDLGPRAPEAR